MLSVEEALDEVRRAAGAPRLRAESVPLAAAYGRVLAEDVAMDHDVPPFRRATMDGFAVRAEEAEIGASFEVRGAVMAGDAAGPPVGAGQAVRVMTGAPVPDGADTVLPFEWMEAQGERAVVRRLPTRDAHVVEPGSHLARGGPVLAAGTVLSAAALGALATAGCAQVPAAARPRVALLGTGSELVPVHEAPGPGRIRNSNSSMLAGQVLRAGGAPHDLVFVRDEEPALRAAVRVGLEADVLVVSGGVSAGDRDLVPAALEAEGVRCVFHRWAVQPGGPLWFGVRGGTLVFGLPGNPAGTFVGFEILVVPALRTRVGLPFAARRTLTARYDGPWGRALPRRRFRPVRLATDAEGRLHAQATTWRGSGDPFGLAQGEGLVAMPEHGEPPSTGPALLPVVPTSEAGLLWEAP